MQKRFLSIVSLALLQIILVGNLQILPANANYGAALPFLYLFAVLGFFIPCILMVAELATNYPQTGGAYIWCEKAFGAKIGFFTVTILWISNLLWYPSIFSLIAANIAYLFNPILAQNKIFVMSMNIILFWIITGLNCISIKFSSRITAFCSVIGIMLPTIIIIFGGYDWWMTGEPVAIDFKQMLVVPNVLHLNNFGLMIGIVISLFGIELSAVHAGNVVNPRRDYPLSLFISSMVILLLLLLSELAIAIIIPQNQLNVQTGLLDALTLFFSKTHLFNFILPIFLLILIGNLGSVAAWMLGSTRSMFVACQKNHIGKVLQKLNRYEAPIGILVCEAIIFTMVSSIFLIFPKITDSFWLLLDLASQVTLIYYILLFLSAIRLRYLRKQNNGFVVPGGNIFFYLMMAIGILTAGLAFLIGFIPPDNLNHAAVTLFHLTMILGLGLTIGLPLLILGRHQS